MIAELAKVAPRPADQAELLVQVAESIRPGSAFAFRMRRAQEANHARFVQQLSGRFSELGQHVAAAGQAIGLGEAVQSDDDITRKVDAIITAAAVKNWASRRLVGPFQQTWLISASATIRLLNREGLDAGMRGSIEKRILAEGAKRSAMVDITGDTRRALFRALEYGREQGLGVKKTARIISEFVPEGRFVNAGASYRSEMIARTETLHAMRAASLEVYRDSPHVQMVTAFDGDGDAICNSRNGQVLTLDAAEGEMSDTHPNCTLTFAPNTA